MPATRPGWIAWAVLLTGALVLFVGGGSRFAIGLALKPMETDLGSGRSLIGVAVGLFQLVSAMALFVSGRLADRMDVTRVLVGGVVLAALGIGLLAWATEPWHVVVLYGGLFALGNGMASVIPVGVLVMRHFPDRAGLATAISLAGLALGQLVMMYVMAPVLAAVGWRAVFGWIGLIHLAVVPLLILTVGRSGSHPARPPVAHVAAEDAGAPSVPGAPRAPLPIRAATRTHQFWLLVAVYALCGFGDFFVSTHVVAFAQDRGVDALFAGRLLAYMGLAALVGVLFAGASADRFGPVLATALCFELRIALFAAVLTDQSLPVVTVFALVFGATFLVTAPLTVVFVRDNFGTRNLGALTGLITMVHHIFGGLGAWIGAALFDVHGSYDAVLAMMLATSAIALVLTLMLRPSRLNAR